MDYSKIGIGVSEAISPVNVPDWDSYFMSLLPLIASRSKDYNTKHAILGVRNNIIIGTGYNSFPAGADDSNLPNNRISGKKGHFILHAEQNLIAHSARHGIPLDGVKVYITGRPCHKCALQLISVGIKDWVIGNVTHQHTEEEQLVYDYLTNWYQIKIKLYEPSIALR